MVAAHKWVTNGKYAITYTNNKTVYMHRLIAGVDGFEVDHINGNKLDNCRANLRPATRSQNSANMAPHNGKTYKGTFPNARGNRFRARGYLANKGFNIGTFDTEIEAARAYDAWAIVNHGEFAWLNFEVAA